MKIKKNKYETKPLNKVLLNGGLLVPFKTLKNNNKSSLLYAKDFVTPLIIPSHINVDEFKKGDIIVIKGNFHSFYKNGIINYNVYVREIKKWIELEKR